jgi:hypothetical protein
MKKYNEEEIIEALENGAIIRTFYGSKKLRVLTNGEILGSTTYDVLRSLLLKGILLYSKGDYFMKGDK